MPENVEVPLEPAREKVEESAYADQEKLRGTEIQVRAYIRTVGKVWTCLGLEIRAKTILAITWLTTWLNCLCPKISQTTVGRKDIWWKKLSTKHSGYCVA